MLSTRQQYSSTALCLLSGILTWGHMSALEQYQSLCLYCWCRGALLPLHGAGECRLLMETFNTGRKRGMGKGRGSSARLLTRGIGSTCHVAEDPDLEKGRTNWKLEKKANSDRTKMTFFLPWPPIAACSLTPKFFFFCENSYSKVYSLRQYRTMLL
jgi:hypothetical protein